MLLGQENIRACLGHVSGSFAHPLAASPVIRVGEVLSLNYQSPIRLEFPPWLFYEVDDKNNGGNRQEVSNAPTGLDILRPPTHISLLWQVYSRFSLCGKHAVHILIVMSASDSLRYFRCSLHALNLKKKMKPPKRTCFPNGLGPAVRSTAARKQRAVPIPQTSNPSLQAAHAQTLSVTVSTYDQLYAQNAYIVSLHGVYVASHDVLRATADGHFKSPGV